MEQIPSPILIYKGWSKNIFIPKTQFVPAVSLFSFPHSRGWRKDPLYRGDGERFVNGEKKGGL
jgi:hypothetical protein